MLKEASNMIEKTMFVHTTIAFAIDACALKQFLLDYKIAGDLRNNGGTNNGAFTFL